MEVKTLRKEVIASMRSSLTINTLTQCVTELVMNSLDARSTAIAVRINLVSCQVQVIDTGDGISEQNLQRIGKFYMTNRCHSFGDLKKRSKYYGFRGEALASICNASDSVVVMSKMRESEQTFKRTISTPDSNCLCISPRPSHGTTVTVMGMFNKLPVRQKRLKQDSEFEDMKKALEDLTVIHPKVSFTLRNDVLGTLIVNSPKHCSVGDALKSIHPSLKDDQLKFLKLTKRKFLIEALLYKGAYHNNRAQYLYVNKRPVSCAEIHTFVASFYQKSVWGRRKKIKEQPVESAKTKYPVYVININCPRGEFDLLSATHKSQVNFNDTKFIIKCIAKIFGSVFDVEPKQQFDGKHGHDSGDDFQRSECRVSHIAGAVRGYAYKRKRESTPPLRELHPTNTKDNYVIEDDSRDDFANIPSTPYQNGKSKLQRQMQTKKTNDARREVVKNVDNQGRYKKMKVEKKPLPIRLNAKCSRKEHNGISVPHEMCPENRKKSRKKQIPFIHNGPDTLMQRDDMAKIVSQKYASQMAYLVEDVGTEITATKPDAGVDRLRKENSIKGKKLIMDKFLKCTKQYVRSNHSSDDFENVVENEPKNSVISDITAAVSINIQKADEANSNPTIIFKDFDIEMIEEDLDKPEHSDYNESTYFEVHKPQGNLQNKYTTMDSPRTSQQTVGKPCGESDSKDSQYTFKHPNSKMKKRNTFPRIDPRLRDRKSKSEIKSKDMTSKCVQTTMTLENETGVEPATVKNLSCNYVPEPEGLFAALNRDRLFDQKQFPQLMGTNTEYPVEQNQFSNHEWNGKASKRKSLRNYVSNYDYDFANFNNIPTPIGDRKNPYYFSYEDKTVKLFDCYETKSHNRPQTWTFSLDYSKPFRLMGNCDEFLQQRSPPSYNDKIFLTTSKVALHSQHDERENFNLLPVDKTTVANPQIHQRPKQIFNADKKLLTPKRKRISIHLQNQKIPNEDCFINNMQLPLPKNINSLKSYSENKGNKCEMNHGKAEMKKNKRILNFYDGKNCLPREKEARRMKAEHPSMVRDHYPASDGKLSPSTNLRINFTRLRDSKLSTNFIHKDVASKGIDGRTADKRKNVTMNISFLNISSKLKNAQDTTMDTFLNNVSFTSFHFNPEYKSTQLSFMANQIEEPDGGKVSFDDRYNTKSLSTPDPDACFSLIGPDHESSRDMFATPFVVSQRKIVNVGNLHSSQSRIQDCDSKLHCGFPEDAASVEPPEFHSFGDVARADEVPRAKSMCEWTKILDQFGTTFYFNKRTGMTTFYSPKSEEEFKLAPRLEFIPKGLSPILIESKLVDKTLSPQEKRKLQRFIIESYENELLTVKWLHYGIQNDPKHFFDELYKEKAKLYEPPVPVAEKGSVESLCFDKSLFSNIIVIGQVDMKFIATMTDTTGHIILFDQHAVHERICLERLQKEYDKASWNLKHPVTIFLQNSDLELVLNQRDYLAHLGLDFHYISNGIIVNAIPLCLWKRVIKENKENVSYVSEVIQVMIDQVLEIVKSNNCVGHVPPIMENVIKMEACRGAIKFGQVLSRETCADLIKELQSCALPFQCAHGRPTLQPLLQLNNLPN